MANVRKSLNQFTSIIDGESLPLNLQQTIPKSLITESNKSPCIGNFSQNAIEFLDQFDKRKHNKLLELSDMKLPNDECPQPQVQVTE